MSNPRRIFISASALKYAWQSEDEHELARVRQICDEALFFFGSKRLWLFPANEAELLESRFQGDYEPPMFPQELLDLIKEKEARTPSEVHFLKPPELQYEGFGTGCHAKDPAAPAFKVVSTWLQQHGLNPLELNCDWWLDGSGYDRTEGRTGVCGAEVVKNYEIGEHDYDPCIELLYQSNPESLEPCMEIPCE